MQGIFRFVLLLSCLACSPTGPARIDLEAAEERVKEAAGEFLKHLKDTDTKQLMAVTSSPWLGENRQIALNDTDREKALCQRLGKFDAPLGKLEVFSAVTLESFASESKDEDARKVFAKVIGKEDWIILVGSKDPPALRYLLVRTEMQSAKVAGGPYRLSYLLMRNEVPAPAMEIIAKADQVTLFSLSPDKARAGDESFRGWKVLGKTTLTETEARKCVYEETRRAVEKSEGIAAACFHPRHGLRFVYKDKTVECVFCFECFRLELFNGTDEVVKLQIHNQSESVLDKFLKDAGVPLAPKPE